MTGRYARHSKVMTIANRLVKQGYNRAHAMVKAWALVKLPNVLTKVAGVTYGKRQTAIEHLTHYRPQDVRISLYRDEHNAADKNAVAVIAAVRGKGAYTIGYLPKAFAAFIAPLRLSSKSVCRVYRAADGHRQRGKKPLGRDSRRSGALSELWNENRGDDIRRRHSRIYSP